MQLATGTNKGHTTGNMQRAGIPQGYQSPNPFDDVPTSHHTFNAYQHCLFKIIPTVLVTPNNL